MKNKTFIQTTRGNFRGDYKEGEVGYIDGYIQASNDTSYAVVVFKHTQRLELVELRHCKLL